MSYLVLAQKKLITFARPLEVLPGADLAGAVLNSRVLTPVLLVLLALSLLFYGMALYTAFNFGFEIRGKTAELREWQASVEEQELAVEGVSLRLASEGKNVLESMQKISAISYVLPPSVMTSQINKDATTP